MGRGLLLTSNLPQLQNLIKRDPVAYKEEFLQQWTHYNNIREIFKINPDEQAHYFRELVTFISQVATCYPSVTQDFPLHLSSLLLDNFGTLSSDMRKTLVQNLVMLRNKDVISSIQLLKTLFPLLTRTSSTSLRFSIRKTILADIRTANLRTRNHKLNKAVQAMLFNMVERGMDLDTIGDKGKLRTTAPMGDINPHDGGEAMWAVILTKELWSKGIWTDPKTVSIVSLGCLHPITKVQSASVHFFLNNPEDEEGSEEEGIDVKALQHRREINKKTRSGDKKLRKQVKFAQRMRQQKPESKLNCSALQLLHDPQTFAEKLYHVLNSYDKRFSLDHKILLMQLLARTMGLHKLCVLGFYSYVMKYLAYKQPRIPAILVALAQSVHEMTPPDALIPVIRKIAQEFVHPGVASEVIAAGLNSIREVCRRQPWAMEEDLLGDLIEYRKSRDKAVTAAARGLLRLYREVNPSMLKRRERGKEGTIDIRNGSGPLPFGHSVQPAVDIEGLAVRSNMAETCRNALIKKLLYFFQLLEDHLSSLQGGDVSLLENDSDDTAWEGWNEDSSETDSNSEGWINVEGEDDDLIITDSEDEDHGVDNTKEINENPRKVSTLATTKILTPADFALLNHLRLQTSKQVERPLTKRKLATLKSTELSNGRDEDVFISENDILGPRKKAKASYAERMASIQKGREGRGKFGSHRGKQNKDVPSSSTNREKNRNKPLMMVLSSGAVQHKKRASLREKQQKLRAHIQRTKKER